MTKVQLFFVARGDTTGPENFHWLEGASREMGVTAEGLVYFLTALNIIAGSWLIYKIIEPEFRGWQDRRRLRRHSALSSRSPDFAPKPVATKRFVVAVRGYDSPELRREDTLLRIRQLGDKIARYLREIERYRDLK